MALVVNPLLLSFLLEEGYVLCQHDTHCGIRLLRRNMLFVVYKYSGQQDLQIFRQFNTYETLGRGIYLYLESSNSHRFAETGARFS